MSNSVTRYVVTHINRDGDRVLTGSCQGRYTYATPEEAEAHLDAMRRNNTRETLTIYGPDAPETFEVRPCECWPVHFDPKGIYFN